MRQRSVLANRQIPKLKWMRSVNGTMLEWISFFVEKLFSWNEHCTEEKKNNHIPNSQQQTQKKNLFWSLSGGKQVKGYVSFVVPYTTVSIQATAVWEIGKSNKTHIKCECLISIVVYIYAMCMRRVRILIKKRKKKNIQIKLLSKRMFDLMCGLGVSFVLFVFYKNILNTRKGIAFWLYFNKILFVYLHMIAYCACIS